MNNFDNSKEYNKSYLDRKINEFINTHNMTDKYSARELSRWHMLMTFSCPQGRFSYASKNKVDMDNDMFTVQEFFDFCKNQYGNEAIKKLEKRMLEYQEIKQLNNKDENQKD